jgi:excisionase family DNA binding protein
VSPHTDQTLGENDRLQQGSVCERPCPKNAAEVVSVSESQRLAYSIREAAACLGVHPLTVRAAISRGELRTIRLGRRILIPRSAVDELLAGERPDVRVAP